MNSNALKQASVPFSWIVGGADAGLSELTVHALQELKLQTQTRQAHQAKATTLCVSYLGHSHLQREKVQSTLLVDTRTLGHLDTWTFRHLDTWTLEHLETCESRKSTSNYKKNKVLERKQNT